MTTQYEYYIANAKAAIRARWEADESGDLTLAKLSAANAAEKELPQANWYGPTARALVDEMIETGELDVS